MFTGRGRPRILLAATVVSLLLAATACSTSGRDLDPPDLAAPAAQIAGGSSTTEFVPPVVTGLGGFEVRGATFVAGGPIPVAHTLGGGNAIPPLDWVNVPAGTVELVLVMSDIDNDDEIRWFVAGIPAELPGFIGGQVPAQAIVLGRAPSAAGGDPSPTYRGPEAPLGVTHRFVFTLHAFDAPTGLGPDDTIADGLEVVSVLSTTSASLLVTHTGT